jgi:hypothetical protein
VPHAQRVARGLDCLVERLQEVSQFSLAGSLGGDEGVGEGV